MKTNDIRFTAEALADSAIQVIRNMDNVQYHVFKLIRNSLEESGVVSLQSDSENFCIDADLLLDPAIARFICCVDTRTEMGSKCTQPKTSLINPMNESSCKDCSILGAT